MVVWDESRPNTLKSFWICVTKKDNGMTGSCVVHILWLQECLWESLSKQWLNCLGFSSTFTLLVFDNQQKKEEQDGNPQVRFLYPYHLHLQTHTHTRPWKVPPHPKEDKDTPRLLQTTQFKQWKHMLFYFD